MFTNVMMKLAESVLAHASRMATDPFLRGSTLITAAIEQTSALRTREPYDKFPFSASYVDAANLIVAVAEHHDSSLHVRRVNVPRMQRDP